MSFAAASSGFFALTRRVFSSSIKPASSKASTMVWTFLATDWVNTFERLLSDSLWSSSEINSGSPSVPKATIPVVGIASKEALMLIKQK